MPKARRGEIWLIDLGMVQKDDGGSPTAAAPNPNDISRHLQTTGESAGCPP